jgi:hypothetical protein
MATYRVTPLPDGVDQRGSWQVKKNGRRVSAHLKKRAAKREARRRADPDDSIVLHRTDGTQMG